ncbi:MAG: ABC transporter substrate-binding protein [Thermoplasmata archaeon]
MLVVTISFIITGFSVLTSDNSTSLASGNSVQISYDSNQTNVSGGTLSLGIVDTSLLASLNYFSPTYDYYFSTLLYSMFVTSAFPPAPLVEPVLAQGWIHIANYTSWVLNLRSGLKWDNGSPLNSTDLVFLIAAFDTFGDLSFASNVTNISIVNSTAVRITTNAPEPNLLYDWAVDEDGAILPYQTYKRVDPSNITFINTTVATKIADFNYNNIIADGPFVFYNYTPGENPITFVPNPYYYEGEPHYKKMTVTIFPTLSSEIASYKAGKLYAIYDPGAYNEVVPLLSKPGYTVFTTVPANEMEVIFNMHAFPFGYTNFRKAIALIINRTEINAIVDSSSIPLVNYADLLPGMEIPGLNSSELPTYSCNFTELQKLLNSVGIVRSDGKWVYKSNGTQVSFNIITTNYGEGDEETATLISSELNNAGFSTTVTDEVYSTYDATITTSPTGWQVGVSEDLFGVNPNPIGQYFTVIEQNSSTASVYPAYNGTNGWNGTYFADLVNTANTFPIGSSAADPYLVSIGEYLANMVPFIPIFVIYGYVAYSNSIYWGNQSANTGIFNTQNEVPNDFWYNTLYLARPLVSPTKVPINPLLYEIPIIAVVVIVAGILSYVLLRKKKNEST